MTNLSARVILVEAADRLLRAFPPEVSAYAKRELEHPRDRSAPQRCTATRALSLVIFGPERDSDLGCGRFRAPPLAPAAKHGEHYVPGVIRAAALGKDKPAPFRYRHQGNLAVGLAHIYFLIGVRAPILVAAQWFWAYLTFGRGARLITGLLPRFEDPKMQPRVTDGKPLSRELAG